MICNILNAKPAANEDENTLLLRQKKRFNLLFLCLLVIGIIPYITTCISAVKASAWHIIVICTSLYFLGIGAVFFEKIPFRMRVWTGLSVFYFMGAFCIYAFGRFGMGQLYLFCFSALAVMFINLKSGLITLVMNMATLLLLDGLFFYNLVSPSWISQGYDPQNWLNLTGTFFVLSAVIILCLGTLLNSLETDVQQFKHIAKSTTDIIWTLNNALNMTYVNTAVSSMLGYGQKEWIGLPLNRFLNEGDSRRLTANLNKNHDFKMGATILHKNGTPIPVEISGVHNEPSQLKPCAFQGAIKDRRNQAHLENNCRQLKEKLVQAEKLKTLGILSGSVAHDLNNILSGIATYPEVLLMDTTLDPDIEKGLKLIKDSGQKASAVVSDLLTISRGLNAEKEVININTVLERYANAHDFMKIKKSYPTVTIELMTEPELLNMHGSYIHIEKSIMNLVLNAAEEVSAKKDGHLLISTANTYFDAAVPGHENKIPGEYVVLRVTDNGSGISRENQKKIFDPFYTKKEMGKSGTGLGLTVVWNAVQDHGGYVDVTSGHKGTTFELIFPATRDKIPMGTNSGSLDEILGQGQMILVVDDLENQQKIALRILEKLGYQACAVGNGYDAVEFIKQTPADLVILDMIMAPSISGLETYKRIKKINPGQKAIIASGYAASDDVLTAQHLGAGSFVKKPYTILDMGIAIKEELEK